jgi:hypothetical protein
MSPKFELEKGRVERLMQRLGKSAEYLDPQPGGHARDESGADVIAVIDGQRIGIQVTDIDTGDKPGQARQEEAALARDGTTYCTSIPIQVVVRAITRSVERKSRISSTGFDEFWLLLCCGLPQWGAMTSTMVMTPWLDPTLDAATLPILSGSNYSQAFIHAPLGIEEQALYQWARGGAWAKSTVDIPAEHRGPSIWDIKNNLELFNDLFNDPKGWSDREVERFFAESQNR